MHDRNMNLFYFEDIKLFLLKTQTRTSTHVLHPIGEMATALYSVTSQHNVGINIKINLSLNSHFAIIQQHPIHGLDGAICSLLRLKVNKAVAF